MKSINKAISNSFTTKSFRQIDGGSSTFTSLSEISNLFKTESAGVQNDFALLGMFNEVPELYSPIKYSANLAADVPYKIVRYDDKGNEIIVKSNEIDYLLNNPNPYQSAVNFKRSKYINYQLFGNNYTNVYKGKSSLKIANYLFLLPPQYVNIIFEQMNFDKVNPDADFRTNKITGYKVHYANRKITIPENEVIHLKDSQTNFDDGAYAKGQSRAYSAIMACKTLKAGYEAKYSFYINRGALGMFINNDPDGAVLQPKEKRRVLNELKQKYGLKERQDLFMFLNHNMTYQNIAPDFAGLKINENNELDFITICKALGGFPPSLLQDKRVALQRVRDEKLKELYGSIIKPMVNDDYEKLSNSLGFTEKGIWVLPDYSKIAVLQEDLNAKITINKTISDGVSSVLIGYNDNNLSYSQASYLLKNKWDVGEDEINDLLIKPEKPEANNSDNEN